MRPQCTAPSCFNPQLSKQLCSTHYTQVLLAGPRPPCSVEGCDRPARTKGLCNAHYVQAGRTGGDPLGHLPRRQCKPCSIDECERKAVAFGLCFLHDQRIKRSGTTDAPGPRPRNMETCVQCGKEFAAKPNLKQRFCSWACADAYKRIPDQTCPVCGKPFHASPGQLARGVGKYCGATCFGIAQRGPEICSVEGCGRKVLCNGCCRRHDPTSREQGRVNMFRRRARMEAVFVEKIDFDAIYERDRGVCFCGKPVTRTEASIDHIVPVSAGGKHQATNVRIAHKRCNSKRGARGAAQPFLL